MVLNNGKQGVSKHEGLQPLQHGVASLLFGGADPAAQCRDAVKPWADCWPAIAILLGGMPETKDQPAFDGGTVTFFVRDGKIRFSVNVKALDKTFIGEVADPLKPFDSVELAMTTGMVSSKRYSERMNGSSMVPSDVKLY